MRRIESEQQGLNLIFGGAVLGGGGGGCVKEARKSLSWALSRSPINIISAEELEREMEIATVALVGPPSTKEEYPAPQAFIDAWEILQNNYAKKIGGIITNENGGFASINGFCQGAALDLPIVDIPCNGRAHPLGLMGAMGLQNVKDYESSQAAVSFMGDRKNQFFFRGEISLGSNLVVSMAAANNSMVAVARNPVSVKYAMENGAPGALEQAYQIGKQLLELVEAGGDEVAKKAAEILKGEFLGKGFIKSKRLDQNGGLDLGTLIIEGLNMEISFYNEFINVRSEKREVNFPDLITIFDCETGWPQSAVDLKEGQEVSITVIPQKNLLLGAGMRDPHLNQLLEEKMKSL